MKELISVVVPVYNAEKYLDKCVKSILGQTYGNIELILVNDGSLDNSGDICEKWAQKDERIKVYHKVNGGASSARNYGIKVANGEFVQFVDSDDFIDNDFVECLANEFDKDNEIDLVISGFVIESGDEKIYHTPNQNSLYTAEQFNTRLFFTELIFGHFAFLDSPINKLYRKSILSEFDSTITISEDKAFNISCLPSVRKLSILKNNGYHYVMAQNSLSHRKYPNLHEDLQAVDDLLVDYIKTNIKENCEDFINYTILETFLRCVRHYIGQGMNNREIKTKLIDMLENKNVQESFKYKSSSLKGKILKFLLKKKLYNLFITFYRFYIKVRRIDLEKI